MTVPGSGDLIGDPAPAATGAAEAAGAGATGAAGRATGLGASTRTFFNVLVGLMGCCPLLLRSLRRNRRLVLYTDIYSLLNGFLGLWEC